MSVDVTWLMDGIFRGGFDTGNKDAGKYGVVALFAEDLSGKNVVDVREKCDSAARDALIAGDRWPELA